MVSFCTQYTFLSFYFGAFPVVRLWVHQHISTYILFFTQYTFVFLYSAAFPVVRPWVHQHIFLYQYRSLIFTNICFTLSFLHTSRFYFFILVHFLLYDSGSINKLQLCRVPATQVSDQIRTDDHRMIK